MEMHLTDPPTSDPLPASKRPAVRLATCTRTLHLFYSFTCLSVLCFSTVASENPLCERVEVYHGFSLRTKYDAHSIQFIGGPQTLDSCQAHCCKTLHCTVYWLLEDTCILADCMKQRCARARIDSGASKLVVMKKAGVAGPTMLHYSPELISLQGAQSWIAWARMSAEFFNTLQRRIKPLRIKRELGAADEKSESDPGAQPLPSTQSNQNGTINDTIKVTEIEKATPIPSTLLPPAGNEPAQAQGNSTESAPLDSPPDTEKEAPGSVTLVPSSISINTSTQPTPAPTSTSPTATVTNKLVVSAGNSVQVTLPKNSVQLNAFVLPEPPEDTTYTYDWRLITHPTDYSGEMEGKHSQALKLSKLTAGLYEFKVIVDGYKAHGEGFVNVTVNPEPRVNQPPIAIVSPRYQEISLPTTSTVIDGSREYMNVVTHALYQANMSDFYNIKVTESTDDDKIVSYHWEEMKGPLREEKVSADTAILKLTNLVPGNYTFSLTVTDSDGAKNSTTANLTVIKAVDYPPVANAGANQVITLPRNSIILYGNLSTDDHGIVSYEWSLSPNSKGKVMEMQGVRTSTLQLSALQEGDYTFLLTVTDSTGQQSSSEVTVIVQPENNKPPEADPGPDKELTLPVDSTTLDGSRSTDDQKIVSYLWEQTRGPDGVKIENANSSIARLTGLQVGNYEFTLTVKDERDLKSQATVSVIVKEEINKPPEAKIAGNVVITLPSNTAELDGSKSTDDQGIVGYQWERDESSPAAGDVLNNSDHHSVLFLSNLVEGTYTFHLKVTDAKGESDTDRATVEVKPDPMKNNLVEMILDVNVSQLTERQKGMFMRQIGVLLGVLDSDITVQKIQLYTEQSTKVVFYVRNQPPRQIMKGYQVAWRLRNELRKQQSDFLIFRALEIDTFTCQLNCSLHGHCNSVTKRCVCDPFWMENILRRQFGDGESNCEWSILYVVISSFLSVVALGLLVWGAICCCRRKKGKPKRKSRYKMLDATDDQESMEMKSSIKTGVKMKSPAQNTSLMHSESELDSDENAYTWSDREKGKLLRPQNGSLRNGHASHKTKIQREEVL